MRLRRLPRPSYTGEVCAFCGKKKLDICLYMPWLSDTDGRPWCGCRQGRDAGVLDRLEAQLRQRATEWAAKTDVYDPDRSCSKCGNPILTTQYHSGYGLHFGLYSKEALPWPYMKRFCGRCEHVAYEVPLDGAEPTVRDDHG